MSELKYKRLDEKYAKDLLNIWSDEDVIKYTNIRKSCTLIDIKNRINILKDFDTFIVINNDEVIGIIGCPYMDKEKLQFGLFYHFCKSSWGKKNGTKSIEWLLGFMKEKYDKLTIFADVICDNIASEKILLYFAFKFISEESKIISNGVKINIHNYRLLL